MASGNCGRPLPRRTINKHSWICWSERCTRSCGRSAACTQTSRALVRLDADADIGIALADADCSHRHFIALFRDATGLAPKRYARLRRFSRVLAQAADGAIEWATLAIDYGYCDQAHLTRDFREFSGVSPSVWQRARSTHPNHLTVE